MNPNDDVLDLNLDWPSTTVLFSTARIECNLINGRTSIGTGFFMAFDLSNEKYVPVLMTNSHVVEGAREVSFGLHAACRHGDRILPSANPVTITYEDFNAQIVRHPDGLDLCGVVVAPLIKQMKASGIKVFYQPFTEKMIATEPTLRELPAMQDVVMAGYPNGLSDAHHGLPILRSGKTASHPAVDFDGKPWGVVDLACYPGSSGSPLLILNEGMYWKEGRMTAGVRALLLGVLFAGPQFSAEGNVVTRPIPIDSSSDVRVEVPMHLGYYIKATELLALKREVFRREGFECGAVSTE